MIQEDILHAVLMKSLISSDLGRTLLARYNQFSCFIRKKYPFSNVKEMATGKRGRNYTPD